MSELEEVAAELDKLWGDQTLATLREEASKELNGTCFKALRQPGGPRRFLLFCITGEYEQARLGDIHFGRSHTFGDWAEVSIFEAVAVAVMAGGLVQAAAPALAGRPKAVVIIAALPDSVTILEKSFNLKP